MVKSGLEMYTGGPDQLVITLESNISWFELVFMEIRPDININQHGWFGFQLKRADEKPDKTL